MHFWGLWENFKTSSRTCHALSFYFQTQTHSDICRKKALGSWPAAFAKCKQLVFRIATGQFPNSLGSFRCGYKMALGQLVRLHVWDQRQKVTEPDKHRQLMQYFHSYTRREDYAKQTYFNIYSIFLFAMRELDVIDIWCRFHVL